MKRLMLTAALLVAGLGSAHAQEKVDLDMTSQIRQEAFQARVAELRAAATITKAEPTVPPTAARAEPMTKVAEMIRSVSMPRSMAILRFWAVARMALPRRVYLMNKVSAAMTKAPMTMITKPEGRRMSAMDSRNGRSGIRLGKRRNEPV